MQYFYYFKAGNLGWALTSNDYPLWLSNTGWRIPEGEYVPEIITHPDERLTADEPARRLTLKIRAGHPVVQYHKSGLPVNKMEVTVMRRETPESPVKIRYAGTVKSLTIRDEVEAELLLEHRLSALNNSYPAGNYQTLCQHALYGTGCKVGKSRWRIKDWLAHTYDGVIQALSDDGLTITCDAFALKPDGWLEAGPMEFFDPFGEPIGVRTVQTHVGNQVELIVPVNFQVGTNLIAYAGCKRRLEEDCIAKFNNVTNHKGFPWIPIINSFEKGVA